MKRTLTILAAAGLTSALAAGPAQADNGNGGIPGGNHGHLGHHHHRITCVVELPAGGVFGNVPTCIVQERTRHHVAQYRSRYLMSLDPFAMSDWSPWV